MNADRKRAKSIFQDAAEIASLAEREAFVAAQCGDDEALRREVADLLEHHAQARGFLEAPANAPVPTVEQSPAESPGAVIGPYKLLQQIGEGGMGTVWMAQQTEPVKRLVAVKLIKAGMDSRQVIARFEAERQALALMDHPNIARVLDGGTTKGEPGGVSPGRPYFVMDLVKGVPITRYCDEHHLTPRQRLELFLPVCQAVQHAHQKGLIHRDLKPSNVLVTLYDGKPVPKVIDFGVAKATGPSLTEKTLVTGFGTIVGTLEYMSPEQAEINQLDIDTRSDIYSLGVLLYELLTGSPPFSRKELQKAGMLEMLRVIREKEPSKPSTKLSTAEGLPTLAANRGTEPAKLTKLVRGELDWIVMKALEKDRNRRYETANGFAMDVQRYLTDEPVLAGRPSARYRLKKFVQRNKGPVIAVNVILLCLVAGIIGTSAALVWAVRERNEKAEALSAETKARDAEKQARDRAMAALRALTDDFVQNQIARGTTLTEEDKEFLRKIIKLYEGFAAITADDAESRSIREEGYFRVGLMRQHLGELKEAEAAYRESTALLRQLAAEFPTQPDYRHRLCLNCNQLGNVLRDKGHFKEAENSHAEALALLTQLHAEEPSAPGVRQDLAGSYLNQANLFRVTNRFKEAETDYNAALVLQKELVAEFPKVRGYRQELARIQTGMGNLFRETGRHKLAETSFNDAINIQRQLVADFPKYPGFKSELANSFTSLGVLFEVLSRPKEMEAAFVEALTLKKQLAADFPTFPGYRQGLALAYSNLGNHLSDPKEAEGALTNALELRKRLADDFRDQPEFRRELAASHVNLGSFFSKTGRSEQAETAYTEALTNQKKLADEFPMKPDVRQDMAGS
jgi:serine/threonine protein kinase